MLRTLLAILAGLGIALALSGFGDACLCPAMAEAELVSDAGDRVEDAESAPTLDSNEAAEAFRVALSEARGASVSESAPCHGSAGEPEGDGATAATDSAGDEASHSASECECPTSGGAGCGCGCVATPFSGGDTPALLTRMLNAEEKWSVAPGPDTAPLASIDWTPQPVLLDVRLAARPPPDAAQRLRAGPRLHLQHQQLLI